MPEPGISPNSLTFLSPFLPRQSDIPGVYCLLANGNWVHFTDECVMKWREQQHYVAASIAGVTAEPTLA